MDETWELEQREKKRRGLEVTALRVKEINRQIQELYKEKLHLLAVLRLHSNPLLPEVTATQQGRDLED
jgi:hypothetical protein